MASLKEFDGNAFSVDDDKDDLISSDDGPVIGKGGHVIGSRGSIDLQIAGSKGEATLLHSSKSGAVSGKDLQTSHGLKIIVGVAVGFSILVTVALVLTIYLGHGQIGSSGAVASDSTECSNIGLTILQMGGNAVDAAVTTMLCLGVVNSHASGIGGGGFMMVHDHKTHEAKVFDFREMAPQTARRNMFGGDRNKSYYGGFSVAVPGEVKGMEMAHKNYGRLPWKSVVKPAADLARNGFKVTKSLERGLNRVDKKYFMGTKLGEIYLTSNNEFVQEGMTIKNLDLADTLDIIGNKGSKAIYDGELTQSILDAVNDDTGTKTLTASDLKNYKVEVRDVVKTTYHDQTLISVPAPASGPVLLSIMNILEGYNFGPQDRNTVKTVHRMLQAFKFGFAQQQQLGDPKFEPSVQNATVKMLSKEEAKFILNKTTEKTQSDPAFYNGVIAMSRERGTSHLSIIDAQELMVSVTMSINNYFGSKLKTETGIVLNNVMADFADPDDPETANNKLNYIEPGKRPLSNMSPIVLYNQDSPCKMRLVVGGVNGSMIVSGVSQVLINVVSFGMMLSDAITAPRIHTQLYPDDVLYEDGWPDSVIDGLKQLEYKMVKRTEFISVVQGIKKVNNIIHAISDPRRGGQAAMFNTNV